MSRAKVLLMSLLKFRYSLLLLTVQPLTGSTSNNFPSATPQGAKTPVLWRVFRRVSLEQVAVLGRGEMPGHAAVGGGTS